MMGKEPPPAALTKVGAASPTVPVCHTRAYCRRPVPFVSGRRPPASSVGTAGQTWPASCRAHTVIPANWSLCRWGCSSRDCRSVRSDPGGCSSRPGPLHRSPRKACMTGRAALVGIVRGDAGEGGRPGSGGRGGGMPAGRRGRQTRAPKRSQPGRGGRSHRHPQVSGQADGQLRPGRAVTDDDQSAGQRRWVKRRMRGLPRYRRRAG